jgi:hypothetical protein
MHGLELVNGIFDVILVLTSFWMAYIARKMKIGGAVGATVTLVATGAIVLGFAHLLETVIMSVFAIQNELNEFIHRCIILVGFLLLTIGLSSLAKSFGSFKKR